MKKMDTHMLVVHVSAPDVEATIAGVKRFPVVRVPLNFSLDHVETLEGYCGTCEDRCTTRNCENKSR